MTDRERLIELKINFVENFCCGDCKPSNDKCRKCLSEKEADYLLENGVIVPPCKNGDYIYFTTKTNGHCSTIKFGRVYEIYINSNDNLFLSVVEYDEYDDIVAQWDIPECQWGKTVFLTREEAEKALKEIEEEWD